MARLVFGMNQSLDGYVDHMAFGPSPTLFRHFIGEAEQQAGSIYGRKIYEIMRDWDASFEISSAIGQTEAVRSGAGIGILHDYIARQYPELVRILPNRSIRRAYWTTYHESSRDLMRIKTLVNFLNAAVQQERHIFV